MNPRITNEIRCLLPSVGVGIALLLCSQFAREEAFFDSLMITYWVSCSMVAVTSFGATFTHGMMNQLLAQPISRKTLWREKSIALASALLCLFLLYIWLLMFWSMTDLEYYRASKRAWLVGLIAPIIASGWGIRLTLFVREPKAALFLTFFAPIVITFAFERLINWARSIEPGTGDDIGFITTMHYPIFALATTLILVSIRAWFVARWSFLQFQDYSILSTEYSIGTTGRITAERGKINRRRGAFTNAFALIRKEVNLQQTNFIFIIITLLMGFILRPVEGPREPAILVMLFTALVAPFLFGMIAISDERRTGVSEWEFTLPTRRARQWGFKLLTIWLLSMLIGGLMIRGIELYSTDIFGKFPFSPSYYPFFALAAAILGLFASSMATNFFQAIGMLAISIVILFLCAKSWSFHVISHFSGSSSSPRELANVVLPIFVSVAVFLSARTNYFSTRVSRRQILKSFARLFGSALVGYALTVLIYYRTWELIPQTVNDGPPIFARSDKTFDLLPNLSRGTAITPDGKLWSADWADTMDETRFVRVPKLTQVGTETNWISVVSGLDAFYALKGDGALWHRGSTALKRILIRSGHLFPRLPDEVIQFGTDNDWIFLAGDFPLIYGIKSNGSLWRWGRVTTDIANGTQKFTVHQSPQQVGTDTNWVQVAPQNFSLTYGLKKGGTVWQWGAAFRNDDPHNLSRSSMRQILIRDPERMSEFDRLNIVEIRAVGPRIFARTRSDEMIANSLNRQHWQGWNGIERPFETNPKLVRLRSDAEWRTISIIFGETIFISTDGQLTTLKDHTWSAPAISQITPEYNWISYAGHDEVFEMKDDGSLWAVIESHNHRCKRLDKPSVYFIPPRFRPYRIGFLFGENDLPAPKPKGH